jgi:hypothetical protein
MRTAVIALSFTVLFVPRGSGQSPDKVDQRDRTFYLTHTPTVQQFQEVATLIRTITNIQKVAADNEQKSVTVHASDGQIAMAEWLFNELDSPAAEPAVSHEYRAPGSTDDVVRVFYVTTAPAVQDFQELATLVRTMSNIVRVFTYNERKALAVRGTDAQVGLAEWLLKELEPKSSPSSAEYRVVPGDLLHDENVVRVLYLTHTGSIQAFQKAATQIRTVTNITRVFTYNGGKALAVRGTAEKVALADSLAKDLDHP